MSRQSRRVARQARARGDSMNDEAGERPPTNQPRTTNPEGATATAYPKAIEDLELAKAMLKGGWQTPAEGRLRLIARLVQIAEDPRTPPAYQLGAINALTKIDECILKREQAEKGDQALGVVDAALQLLRQAHDLDD